MHLRNSLNSLNLGAICHCLIINQVSNLATKLTKGLLIEKFPQYSNLFVVGASGFPLNLCIGYILKFWSFCQGTVKPVLTATSEQRPPVNNDRTKSGQANFDTNFDWKPSTERPPLYNGHFFGVPRVAVVDRFDCTWKNLKNLIK